jgi:hypothetical protein
MSTIPAQFSIQVLRAQGLAAKGMHITGLISHFFWVLKARNVCLRIVSIAGSLGLVASTTTVGFYKNSALSIFFLLFAATFLFLCFVSERPFSRSLAVVETQILVVHQMHFSRLDW